MFGVSGGEARLSGGRDGGVVVHRQADRVPGLHGHHRVPLNIQDTGWLVLDSREAIGSSTQKAKVRRFHRIGLLGRFGLEVAMSVCLSVCLSPPHAIFLRPWTGAERPSSVDWCWSVALA